MHCCSSAQDDSLGYLACKLFRLMSGRLSRRFAEAGIPVTVEQWRVLMHLAVRDGLTQNELTERLTQDKTGVSRLVKELETRGLVRRVAHSGDRRSRRVHLLEPGRDLTEQCLVLVRQVLDTAQAGVAPGDLALCKDVLRRIVHNLNS